MKVRFDFIVHWIYAILWAILAISGFAMVGAKYGWILNFDFRTADYMHRWSAALFVVVTLISIIYEVIRGIRNDTTYRAWHVIGRSGYQLFTYIVTLILIITGAIIWFGMMDNMAPAGFALWIHEKISYLALASVIWHIYMKGHALMWPKQQKE